MKSLILAAAMLVALAPCAMADSLFATSIPDSGNQDYAGDLGDSFTVGGSALTLTQAGVFDDDKNGLKAAIGWELWEGGTIGGAGWTLKASTSFASGTASSGGNYVYKNLNVALSANTNYVVLAYGYGSGDENYNENVGGAAQVGYNETDLVVKNGGYGAEGTPGAGPNSFLAWSPFSATADNFGVATFQYTVGAPIPEPGTLALLGLGVGALALGRRRRKA